MSMRRKIVDEFLVDHTRVLVLDKPHDYGNGSFLLMDGEKYSFGLTHNEYWLIASDPNIPPDMIGKEIILG